jgi:hypothetical protein
VLPLQQLAARTLVNAGGAAAAAVPDAVAHSVASGGLRVAVLGDASSSMQVAINAACICGAMLSACFDADLVFFNHVSFTANSVNGGAPRTVEEMLTVCEEVRASGRTSMAAALDHFYSRGTMIDLFVLVSDEGENTRSRQGLFFAHLFERYVREVNPSARCAFISLLYGNDEGQILKDMRNVVAAGGDAMAGKLPPQHRFDPQRPDLSKFDGLLSTLLQDAREANPLLVAAEAASDAIDAMQTDATDATGADAALPADAAAAVVDAAAGPAEVEAPAVQDAAVEQAAVVEVTQNGAHTQADDDWEVLPELPGHWAMGPAP